MSQSPSLHNYVDIRFREAFGEPTNTMGKDDHWRLQGSVSRLPINVLLNGTQDIPALWIFDADDGDDGVFSASITHQNQVDEIISQIQERVKRAVQPAGAPDA